MNMTQRRWLLVPVLLVAAMSLGWADPAPVPGPGKDLLQVLPDVLSWIGPAATPAPAQPLLKSGDQLAFIGSSMTAFGGWERLTQYVFKTHYPDLKLTFLIAGIMGQPSAGMEPRFAKDMKLGQGTTWVFIETMADVVLAMQGPPDPAGVAACAARVAKMVDMGQAAGAQVVLLTDTIIKEDATSEGNQRTLAYVEAIKQVATEKHCLLADLHPLCLAALAAKPAGSFPLTADNLQMNAYGDAIMAYGIMRVLGVPDEVVAQTDPLPALRIRSWDLTLVQCAELMEVPVTAFNKPELVRRVDF